MDNENDGLSVLSVQKKCMDVFLIDMPQTSLSLQSRISAVNPSDVMLPVGIFVIWWLPNGFICR